jgi:hypothetical protein
MLSYDVWSMITPTHGTIDATPSQLHPAYTPTTEEEPPAPHAGGSAAVRQTLVPSSIVCASWTLSCTCIPVHFISLSGVRYRSQPNKVIINGCYWVSPSRGCISRIRTREPSEVITPPGVVHFSQIITKPSKTAWGNFILHLVKISSRLLWQNSSKGRTATTLE